MPEMTIEEKIRNILGEWLDQNELDKTVAELLALIKAEKMEMVEHFTDKLCNTFMSKYCEDSKDNCSDCELFKISEQFKAKIMGEV